MGITSETRTAGSIVDAASPKIALRGAGRRRPVMVCNWAKGGMRSVVEGYQAAGLIDHQEFLLINAYVDGSRWQKFQAFLSSFFSFWGLLLRGRVEFVHAHVAMRGSYLRKHLYILSAWCFGVATITHLHGSELKTFYARLPWLGKRLVRWTLTRSDRVFVLSDSWRAFVQQVAPRARVEVIHNFVRVPSIEATPGRPGFVLFMGMLGDRKGTFDLIKAWKQVMAVVPDARLKLCGNGEVDRARALIESEGLSESIEVPGWVDPLAREQLLQGCGVFVLPSHNEGLPMSLLEAMALGCTVVTTRVGGIPEVVQHDVNGLLVSAGKPEELAGALIRALKDQACRQRLGAQARATVEARFSDAAVLPEILRSYDDILRART